MQSRRLRQTPRLSILIPSRSVVVVGLAGIGRSKVSAVQIPGMTTGMAISVSVVRMLPGHRRQLLFANV